ncbi:actin-binding protein [Zalerion maritima]|uniref:Actin-binding protein n=1 Tax=Zalerion maritima TaxID=339359 RepID=A0AAD5WS92_9PEZI|nr:actin-binding protein [Zalerion maritima]
MEAPRHVYSASELGYSWRLGVNLTNNKPHSSPTISPRLTVGAALLDDSNEPFQAIFLTFLTFLPFLPFHSTPPPRFPQMAPREGLVHVKEYDIKDSNVELIGTSIDRQVKYNSALTEPAWASSPINPSEPVGSSAGLSVWRIEAFQVVPWPREKHGHFFSGDSFIVLSTCGVADSEGGEKLFHEIFFWLGAHTSQDEAGAAAYKAVELDEFLHGEATQHREVQQAPSDDFLRLFPKMQIREGGVRSGFRHVEEEAGKEEVITLLRVFRNPAGGNGVVVHEVDPKWESLDDEDVFVLDRGDKIWVWQGKDCSPMEKAKAAQVVHDMTLAEHVDVEVLAQEESRSYLVVKMLGGDEETPRDGFRNERPMVSVSKALSPGESDGEGRTKKLFRISDESGELEFELVKEGGDIGKSDLDGNDVFLLDSSGRAIWVWEGQGASRVEKARWLQVTQKYVSRLQEDVETAYLTPVAKVREGNESKAFWTAVGA